MKWDLLAYPKKYGGIGVRDARQSNIALLGKQAWNMFNSPHKLWVKIYNLKYLVRQNLFQLDGTPQLASPTWRSILKAFFQLRDGFIFRLGKGNVFLWLDQWLEDGRLGSMVDIINVMDRDIVVKNIWCNGMWNFDYLATIILEHIKLKIMAILFNQQSTSEDLV